MKEEKDRHWKVIKTEKGFEGTWIHVNLDDIELKDGTKILFEAIEFQRHGAGVVAVNQKNEVMLVKNYRYINDYYSWEVPAGTIPPGMSPSECILEELREEAGCISDESALEYLGYYFPSIGSSNQEFHCFFARDVKQVSGELDANEILEAKWFTRKEIENMIKDGTIKDGFTLYLLMRYLHSGKLD